MDSFANLDNPRGGVQNGTLAQEECLCRSSNLYTCVTANINHITRLRINSDGIGVRSVIFVQGCPLNCFWCCNPETHFTSKYKTLTPDQLNEYIAKDKPYFMYSNGGVTFCGGEPLLYSDFIAKYISAFCSEFSVNIETSLYVEQEKLIGLLPLVDEWYVDFKVFDEKKHIEYTGESNGLIKDNLRFLSQKIDTRRIIVTFPMITDYNTFKSDVLEMIDFLKDIGIYKIIMHPYRKEAETKHKALNLHSRAVPECSAELRNNIESLFISNGFEVICRQVLFEKDKCSYLKHIRKELCENNNIELNIEDCSFKGNCTGTCPQCEHELNVINTYLGEKSKD